jgi:actin-related protein
MFETFEVPLFQLANSGLLSLFAIGKKTGLVV